MIPVIGRHSHCTYPYKIHNTYIYIHRTKGSGTYCIRKITYMTYYYYYYYYYYYDKHVQVQL